MTKKVLKDEFIERVASRAKFSKGDIEKVLNAIREEFIDAIREEYTIDIRNFFKLYTQHIGERKITKGENAGTVYPPVTRNILRLSENIRFADREENND